MHKIDQSNLDIFAVAPRAGAGIEMIANDYIQEIDKVAPRAGAGIEIELEKQAARDYLSPPARGRELK